MTPPARLPGLTTHPCGDTRQGLPLVVGLGSPHGDDEIGWLVVRQLQQLMHPRVSCLMLKSPIDLLHELEGVSRLVIVDACRSLEACPSREPLQPAEGAVTVRRLMWPAHEVVSLRAAGTHAFGLPEVLHMADRLGILPPVVILRAIEGRSFSPGDRLSPPLRQSIPEIVGQILDEDLDIGRLVIPGGMNHA